PDKCQLPSIPRECRAPVAELMAGNLRESPFLDTVRCDQPNAGHLVIRDAAAKRTPFAIGRPGKIWRQFPVMEQLRSPSHAHRRDFPFGSAERRNHKHVCTDIAIKSLERDEASIRRPGGVLVPGGVLC